MYNFDLKNVVKIGIVIITDDTIFDDYALILDEDNKIWYAEKWTNDIRSNQMVCFKRGDNFKALDVRELPKTLFYRGNHDKYFLMKGNDEIGLEGIPNEEILNVKMDFDSVGVYYGGGYGKYCVISSHYIKNDNKILCRYFITDEKEKTYREFSEAVASLYDINLGGNKNASEQYPLNIAKASSIFQIVSNFNPYEVFESYRVEIDYYHESRVGRDDYFFEYKKYSIKYFDDYLARWFKNESIKLNMQSGYTSHFTPSISYKRFYKEENEAKSKAYAEYSKEEHFDCLMSPLYENLQNHLKDIRKSTFIYPKTINIQDDPDELHVRKAYSWVYEKITKPLRDYHFITPKYKQSQKERYEEIIIEALNSYNS